jgi:hypothetical protein
VSRKRFWWQHPEDSDSDVDEADTDEWVVTDTPTASEVLLAYVGTDRPDLAHVLGLRGKRRFGLKCAVGVTGLRPGKSYAIRIRVRNDLGWSDYSTPTPITRTIGTRGMTVTILSPPLRGLSIPFAHCNGHSFALCVLLCGVCL